MSAARTRASRIVVAVALVLAAGAIGYDASRARRDDGAATASTTAATIGAAPNGSTRAERTPAPRVHARTAPLPAPGTPLVREFDALKARADAGDAAAASRLFRDVQRCRAARDEARAIARLEKAVPDPGGDAALVVADAVQSTVRMLSDMRAFVNRSAERCAGATRAQLDALVPSMLRAARLGDMRAIACYAGSGFDMMPGLVAHPEWLSGMRDVPQMLDDAVRQGDWNAVELLHHAYAGFFRATPAGQTIAADPATDYRYLRLERLGANGAFAQKIDAFLAGVTSDLTPQQIGDGDAWAADAYARYFRGSSSNEVANGANICGDPDG